MKNESGRDNKVEIEHSSKFGALTDSCCKEWSVMSNKQDNEKQRHLKCVSDFFKESDTLREGGLVFFLFVLWIIKRMVPIADKWNVSFGPIGRTGPLLFPQSICHRVLSCIKKKVCSLCHLRWLGGGVDGKRFGRGCNRCVEWWSKSIIPPVTRASRTTRTVSRSLCASALAAWRE